MHKQGCEDKYKPGVIIIMKMACKNERQSEQNTGDEFRKNFCLEHPQNHGPESARPEKVWHPDAYRIQKGLQSNDVLEAGLIEHK
jgi:hypothetical protein